MVSCSDGCRLCLDPSEEISTTIDSPALMDQMQKVFCFSIEPKPGYASGVCRICSYTISEFYQYSEKVRQNQQVLNGNATNCDQAKDPKISLECVKQEPLNDFGLPETTEDAHKPETEVPEAVEAPILDLKISQENHMLQTPNDSEILETNQDACELKYEVSEVEKEVQTLHSEITLEEFKIEITDSDLPGTINEEEEEDEILLLDPRIAFESGKVKAPSEPELSKTTEQIIKEAQCRREEDELFKKHISLVCVLCGIQTDSYPALCSHFKEEHKHRNGYVVCCNKKLFNRTRIREHVNFHVNPDIFRCAVCGQRFHKQFNLNAHMLKMHPQTHKCDHCSQRFAEESALAEHITWHMKWRCPKCNEFCTNKTFRNHMISKHGVEKPKMRCDICDKEFLTIRYFDRHIKMHIGIDVQKFKCKVCNIIFKNEKNVDDHIKKWHATDEVQCDKCPRKFKHPRALSSHKRWSHAEFKYECEYCHQKFKLASMLKEHRAVTHTGEVLYTCEYCGASKNTLISMNKHLQGHHPAEVAQKKLMQTKKIDPTEVIRQTGVSPS